MTDLSNPAPIKGQTWPSFPSSWYQDATPDRPFFIPEPPAPPEWLNPPIYQPPAQVAPPYGGTNVYILMAVSYGLDSLIFSPPPALTTSTYYALGAPSFATPTLTTHP
jgi:hypothetical protein